MSERWKACVTTPGYEVSDQGRVRHARTKYVKKLRPNRDGYLVTTVYLDWRSYPRLVHQLVARAFAPGYAEGLDACHNDGVRHHNHHSNLRWDTHQENIRDIYRHRMERAA